MAKFGFILYYWRSFMASRQEIRARRRKKKQQQRMTTILVTAGIALIMAAVLMMPTIRDALTPVGEFVQPVLNPRPMADANAMGNPDAPVVIEEFSDFGCGYCATFAQTTAVEIIKNYVATGQVYMVYNSVGNLLGHPNSIITSEAAYCAGDQNMFWEYHDILYANQPALFANINKKLDKTLEAYAEALGLDVDGFNSCLKSNKYNAEIQQDLVEARQAGIDSTPSFVINGNTVKNMRIDEFQAYIEAELLIAGP
jgi:protein-disulfide isomerase